MTAGPYAPPKSPRRRRRIGSRVRARAVTLSFVLTGAVVLAAASPALASTSEGASGEGLTVLETLLLFVAAPAAIFGVIALLAIGPSMARAGDKVGGRRVLRLPVLDPDRVVVDRTGPSTVHHAD